MKRTQPTPDPITHTPCSIGFYGKTPKIRKKRPLPQPHFIPLGDGTDRLILIKDITLIFGYKGKSYRMKLKKGFLSRGSDLPVGLLFNRKDARTWRAFAGHDWGFATGCWPQKVLDAFYLYELIQGGIPKWKAKTAHRGLRIVGSIPYNNHRKHEDRDFDGHANKYGIKTKDGRYET
ncbi:MAG: hypothetical protein GY861_14615 [bacterium]|nr:hypothetical protein [bacterium]